MTVLHAVPTLLEATVRYAQQAPAADELVSIAERAATLSGPAVVLVVLYLVVRGVLVPRHHVEEVVRLAGERVTTAEADRDWWREVGVQALNVGEAAVGRGSR